MNTMEQIKQFQTIAKEAIAIYDQRIEFYTSVLDKLQAIINNFDRGENK